MRYQGIVGWVYGIRSVQDIVQSEEVFPLQSLVEDKDTRSPRGAPGHVDTPAVEVI